MTGKSIATTPSRLTIEPTGSLRERFAAHIFPLKPIRGAQLVSAFEGLLPPEGSRERELCERRIKNKDLQECVQVCNAAFINQHDFTGQNDRLPDHLVEALMVHALNFNPKKSGLRISESARDMLCEIDAGWSMSAKGQNPLAQLGFYAEGLHQLESVAPQLRFPQVHKGQLRLDHLLNGIFKPLSVCGKVDTDIERRIYVRTQEISYLVNHGNTREDWYLRDAAQFFAPGAKEPENLFAGKGMSRPMQTFVSVAYDFYKSISQDPPYETFVDFARTSLNPLLKLRDTGIPTTGVSVATALFQYAIRMPQFYSYCNGTLPDDLMTLFKVMNPDDDFATAVSPDWRREFEMGVVAAQASALDTRVKMHSAGKWPVYVSYEDTMDLKAHIEDLPLMWPEEIEPSLHQSYQASLKRAVICFNDIIRMTHPEDQFVVPLVADNDEYVAPSVH